MSYNIEQIDLLFAYCTNVLSHEPNLKALHVISVLAFKFHVFGWLYSYHATNESLAQIATPVVFILTLRIYFRRIHPPHHHDLCLAEPSMRTSIHIP